MGVGGVSDGGLKAALDLVTIVWIALLGRIPSLSCFLALFQHPEPQLSFCKTGTLVGVGVKVQRVP